MRKLILALAIVVFWLTAFAGRVPRTFCIDVPIGRECFIGQRYKKFLERCADNITIEEKWERWCEKHS